jgi:hypothetical protein
MISIGTTLSIPDNATQQEWTRAKNAYKGLNNLIAKQYGADIWDKVDRYYELDDRDKDMFLKANPEVSQAMDYKSYAVSQNPLLANYYDGMRNIEDYYKGEFKRQVVSQISPDFYDLMNERDVIALSGKAALDAFDKKIGYSAMMKKYNSFKKEWDGRIEREMLDYSRNLPDRPQSIVQENLTDLSTGQEAIVEAVTPEALPNWQQVRGVMTDTLVIALENYIVRGKPLTSSDKYFLKRTADYLGVSTNDLITIANDQFLP